MLSQIHINIKLAHFWVGMVNSGCGLSGHRALELKNGLMEWTDFLHASANSRKLKVLSLIFELVHETLKSAVS